MVREAHRLLRPRHGIVDHRRIRQLYGYRRCLTPAVYRLERRKGQHDKSVKRLAENLTLAYDNADDGESLAVNTDLAADRVHRFEELLRDFGADDAHGAPLAHVDVGEGLAAGEAIVLDDWRVVLRRPKITPEDAEVVRQAIPEAAAISLTSGYPTPQSDVIWGDRTLGDVLIFGITPDYQVVQDYRFAGGSHRFRIHRGDVTYQVDFPERVLLEHQIRDLEKIIPEIVDRLLKVGAPRRITIANDAVGHRALALAATR